MPEYFLQLEQIFQREISGYKGSVELYLTEQNQKLHVPERIFLHLVENKDGEDPFVFMATYASLGEDHAVHHMPLKYALTEYQDDRDKLLALLSCLNRAAGGIGSDCRTGRKWGDVSCSAFYRERGISVSA